MPKPSLALSMLSLFTTTDRATEIEGDLIEQAHSHGSIWFARHVVLTTLSLLVAAVIQNFVFVSLLSYAAYELSAKLFFWVIRPLRWYVEFELGIPRAPTIAFTYSVVVLFTFVVGSSLVRFLPTLGAQAAIGAIAFFLLRLAVLQEGYTVVQLVLGVAAPMLAGSIWANWLSLKRAVPHSGIEQGSSSR